MDPVLSYSKGFAPGYNIMLLWSFIFEISGSEHSQIMINDF